MKTLSLSPNGNLAAAGYFDGRARLYNGINWQQISCFDLPLQVNFADQKENLNQQTIVYKEEDCSKEGLGGAQFRYANINQQPSSTTVKIPALTKQEIAKFNSSTFEKAGLNGPPTAVSQISWSFDSKFMALRSDLSPNAVYVWGHANSQHQMHPGPLEPREGHELVSPYPAPDHLYCPAACLHLVACRCLGVRDPTDGATLPDLKGTVEL